MTNNSQQHIIKYKTYLFVLLALLLFTTISVAITGVNLGRFAVVGALLLASAKSALVLWYFMHLKYESKVLRIMLALVLLVFIAVMIITFIDYGFQ